MADFKIEDIGKTVDGTSARSELRGPSPRTGITPNPAIHGVSEAMIAVFEDVTRRSASTISSPW